jgi:RHS repeat-associated protein
LLATISPKEGLQQVVVDHQGSAALLVNRCGRRIGELATNPWGLDVFDTTQNPERHRYTGHLRDINAPGRAWDDFHQMHARTYFPYAARFLSPDPGRDYDFSHPQSFNLYAYVRNNPVTLVDPWGLEPANSPTKPRRNCDPDGRGNVECQGQQGFPREQTQASAFLDEKGGYHESVTVLAKPLPTGLDTATKLWLFESYLSAASRHAGKIWSELVAGTYFGTRYGSEALDWYAATLTDPEASSLEYAGAAVGGFFAALWTPETWTSTAATLASPWGAETLFALDSPVFGYGRALSTGNQWLRIGWGRHAGRYVFRVSGKSGEKVAPKTGHIDFFYGPPWP